MTTHHGTGQNGSTEQSPVVFDQEHALAFLRMLYPGVPGLFQIVDSDRNFTGELFPTTEEGLARAVQYAATRDAAKGVYFRTTTMSAPPGRGRGGADVTVSVPFFWSDIDFGELGHKRKPGQKPNPPTAEDAYSLIAAAGLPEPTILVHSGGGLYPLWVVAAPVALEEAKAISEGIQEVLAEAADARGWAHGTGVADLARILRLPGSVNRKDPDVPRPCRVVGGSGQPVDPAVLPRVKPKARPERPERPRDRRLPARPRPVRCPGRGGHLARHPRAGGVDACRSRPRR